MYMYIYIYIYTYTYTYTYIYIIYIYIYIYIYILVGGSITVVRAEAETAAMAVDRDYKQAVYKNCTPFTNCITEIKDAQVGNAKDLDVVMPMYNLTEFSDNYSKTSGSLYQFYKDQPNDNDVKESESFKFKSKFLDNTDNAGIINAKIAVPLRYLRNFWRTLEIPLINCEINLIVIWSANCVISDNRPTTFAITDTKLYVPVVALSTQDNTKLLQQWKSGFKRTINWNKYQSKISTEIPNGYFD